MNALATTHAAPVGATAMIPRNMRDAMDLASMMAKTGFLPKQIQTPGGALFVVEQAMRWNMSPFAVATEVSFISDKPMFSGKIVAAAVQSSGLLAGRLSYLYAGEGEARQVTVRGTIRGEDEPREITVKLRDAKTNNQHWTKQPDQQLAYYGARAWARRHTPEVMLGVYSPEEFDEAPAAAEAPREVPNLHVEPSPRAEPARDVLTILAPSGATHQVAVGKWLTAIGKALAGLESAAAVRTWREAMREPLSAAHAKDADMAMEALRMIDEREQDLTGAADESETEAEG